MSRKLRGEELVEYVRSNSGLPEKDLAVGAGYFSEVTDESGETRVQVNVKPFYQALSLASGLVAPSTVGKKEASARRGGGGGRALTYNIKTNGKSGNAVVTGGYLRQIGIEPGQRLSVEIVEEAGEIVLKLADDQDFCVPGTTRKADSESPSQPDTQLQAEPAYA